ncbi:hypothetical protein RhiJN_24076 [Ceratobasidium sp. AG-Ba]|nr:hypothetical protein RhiJN_24076 [Ceratobasidium sp. AG-Ba]
MGSSRPAKRKRVERQDSDGSDDDKRHFQITLVLDPSKHAKKQKIDLRNVHKKAKRRVDSDSEDDGGKPSSKGRRLKHALDENAALVAEVARLRAKLTKRKRNTSKKSSLDSSSSSSSTSSKSRSSSSASSSSSNFSSSDSSSTSGSSRGCRTSTPSSISEPPILELNSSSASRSSTTGRPTLPSSIALAARPSQSTLEETVLERSITAPQTKAKMITTKFRELLGLKHDKKTWLEYLGNVRRILVVANIDWDTTWKQQSTPKTANVLNMIEEEMPCFKRFYDQWGAEWIALECFNHRRSYRMAVVKPREEKARKRKSGTLSGSSDVKFV